MASRLLRLWVCLSLCTGALAQPTPEKTLTFTTVNFYQHQNLDQLEGVQHLRTALANLGYQLKIQSAPPERSLRMVDEGVVDGELLRLRDMTPYFDNLVLIKTPLQTSAMVLATSKAAALGGNTWANFHAQRFITVKGIFLSELLPRRFHKLPNVEVESYPQALKMLQAGRADLILLPEAYFPVIEQMPGVAWPENFTILKPVLFEMTGFVHLHKRHTALATVLEQELKRVMAETACTQRTQPQACTSDANQAHNHLASLDPLGTWH